MANVGPFLDHFGGELTVWELFWANRARWEPSCPVVPFFPFFGGKGVPETNQKNRVPTLLFPMEIHWASEGREGSEPLAQNPVDEG